MREKRRKHRRVAAAVSVSTAVVLFAALGGAGLAQTALEPAAGLVTENQELVTQNQGGEKVEVCHKGKNTISISVNALPAHLQHGDTESECALAVQATDTTGVAKPKKAEKKQSTESAELSATETKKPKAEKSAQGASTGGQEKAKLAKSKSKKKAAAGMSDEMNVTHTTSPKPKKLKPTKLKGGSASPPGLGGAAPPGHGNSKGNGKNK